MEKITQQEIESVYVQGAPTKLTGSAQENKQVFDKLPLMVVSKINDIIDELSSGGGADSINGSYNGIVMSLQGIVDMIATEIGEIEANYLPKSGGTMTGDLVLNAAPTADLEAANKKYVDDTVLGAKPLANELHFYGGCLSAANEANKVVTVSDDNFKLMSGVAVDVSFLNANTASRPTLNVNNTGAVEIKAYSTTVPLANQWRQGAVVRFVYNTSNWVMVDGSVASTTYYGATKLNSSTSSTSEDTAATPLAVKQAYDKAVESDNKIDALETKINNIPKSYYGLCNTAAAEKEKIVTVDDSFKLEVGATVNVRFNYNNTHLIPVLNVNNTGAKPMAKGTLITVGQNYWTAGGIVQFVYDGSYWVVSNALVGLSDSVENNSVTDAATSAAVKKAYDKAVEAKTVADAAATPEYVDTTVEQFVQSALQTVENNYLPLTGGVIEAAPGSTPEGNTSLTIKHGNTSIYLNADTSVYDYDGNGNPIYASDSMITVSNQDGNTVNSAIMGTYFSIPIIASGGSVGGTISVFKGTDVSDTLGDNALVMYSADGVRALHNLTAPLEESDATNKQYVDDAVAGVKEVADSAKAIAEVALPKTGGTMTGSLVLNAAPTADLEAANKKYVDDAVAGVSGGDSGCNCKHYYGECTTSPATAAKIVTVSENFVLEKGASIDVMFTYHNTASSPTMNVNGTGAKAIKKYNTSAEEMSYRWAPNSITRFTYDGTYWFIENGTEASTTYYGITKLNDSVNSTSTTEAATANVVKQVFDYADEAYTLADQAAPMCFNNVTVAYTSGVSDNTYPDYPIRYDVTCNGLTTNYSADVRFGMTEVISGNFAPICDTATNIVKIFAKTAITADITIPTIVCTKVVYE